MRCAISILASICITVGAVADDRRAQQPPPISVSPATAEHQATIANAVAEFTEAGLTLPPLQIVFSDRTEPCAGHPGLFEPAPEPMRITICSDLRFVPVHELAHAWIEANVDESRRSTYLRLRNKQSWNSSADQWRDRGVEDAAFVIQQVLTVHTGAQRGDEWDSRIAAFEHLTRTTPMP